MGRNTKCNRKRADLLSVRELFVEYIERNNVCIETDKIKPGQVKNALQALNQGEFTFHIENGYPDIICSANLSFYDLLREKEDQHSISEDETKLETTISNDYKTLHAAVALIKDKIDTIPPSTEYWAPLEVLLDKSEKFFQAA